MSKYFDMIAKMEINISKAMAKDAGFDKLLIVGPLPKTAVDSEPAKVAAYTSLEKVLEAGWKNTGDNIDPVALAAQVAFSQKPKPQAIYIAPIQVIDGSPEKAVDTVKRAVETPGWWAVCLAGVEESEYDDVAKYIETQEKFFCYPELNYFKTSKPTLSTDYFRSHGIFALENSSQTEDAVPAANKYMHVAFVAKWLSYKSGSETTAYKTLFGVKPASLDKDEMKALLDANISYLVSVGGRNVTMGGAVLAGEWADVIRFRDWLKNDMQSRIVDMFISNPKINFTNGGMTLIHNQIAASLKAGQAAEGIAEDEYDSNGDIIPAYVINMPDAASLTPEVKSKRELPAITFEARLASAIHFTNLNGNLKYDEEA